MPTPPVHLEGTTLEGGGQLLRLALSLSSLTHIPIHVTRIRGNRSKDGGLKPAHLAGVQWLVSHGFEVLLAPRRPEVKSSLLPK